MSAPALRQILQIRVGDTVLQIVPGEIRIDSPVDFGDWFLVPDLLLRAHGSCDDRVGFFFSAFGFSLESWDKGLVFWGSFVDLGAFHTLLCHHNHLGISMRRQGQNMRNREGELPSRHEFIDLRQQRWLRSIFPDRICEQW